MTEHPILFSGPMVLAILDGRKTQTRRLAWVRHDREDSPALVTKVENGNRYRASPWQKARPGDRLWVRETWRPIHSSDPQRGARYRADLGRDDTLWRPSIHMPRWASRITLEVTGVKIERVQEISEEDALAEGFEPQPWRSDDPTVHRDASRDWFSDLWSSLHKKPGSRWEDNPLVVVSSFKRVEP